MPLCDKAKVDHTFSDFVELSREEIYCVRLAVTFRIVIKVAPSSVALVALGLLLSDYSCHPTAATFIK